MLLYFKSFIEFVGLPPILKYVKGLSSFVFGVFDFWEKFLREIHPNVSQILGFLLLYSGRRRLLDFWDHTSIYTNTLNNVMIGNSQLISDFPTLSLLHMVLIIDYRYIVTL